MYVCEYGTPPHDHESTDYAIEYKLHFQFIVPMNTQWAGSWYKLDVIGTLDTAHKKSINTPHIRTDLKHCT